MRLKDPEGVTKGNGKFNVGSIIITVTDQRKLVLAKMITTHAFYRAKKFEQNILSRLCFHCIYYRMSRTNFVSIDTC